MNKNKGLFQENDLLDRIDLLLNVTAPIDDNEFRRLRTEIKFLRSPVVRLVELKRHLRNSQKYEQKSAG